MLPEAEPRPRRASSRCAAAGPRSGEVPSQIRVGDLRPRRLSLVGEGRRELVHDAQPKSRRAEGRQRDHADLQAFSEGDGIDELAGEQEGTILQRHERKHVSPDGERVVNRLRVRHLTSVRDRVLSIGGHPGVLAAPHPDLAADGVRPGRRVVRRACFHGDDEVVHHPQRLVPCAATEVDLADGAAVPADLTCGTDPCGEARCLQPGLASRVQVAHVPVGDREVVQLMAQRPEFASRASRSRCPARSPGSLACRPARRVPSLAGTARGRCLSPSRAARLARAPATRTRSKLPGRRRGSPASPDA